MVWPLPSMVILADTGGSNVVPSAILFCSRMRSPAAAPEIAADNCDASDTRMSLAIAGVVPMTGNAKAMTKDVDASKAARNRRVPNRSVTIATISPCARRKPTSQPPQRADQMRARLSPQPQTSSLRALHLIGGERRPERAVGNVLKISEISNSTPFSICFVVFRRFANRLWDKRRFTLRL